MSAVPTASSRATSASVDLLAGAVLRSLGRPVGVPPAWRLGKNVALGLLTLGTAPVIEWIYRFRRLSRAEAQQFWHLAEWMRLRSGQPDTAQLLALAQRCRGRRWLEAISVLAVAIACAAVIVSAVAMCAGPVLIAWPAALVVAYAAQLTQFALHARDVAAFVERFNVLIPGPEIPLVPNERLALGYRRYLAFSDRTRGSLARSFCAILRAHRPAYDPEPRMWLWRCPNPACIAELPESASFCPQCGQRIETSASPLPRARGVG